MSAPTELDIANRPTINGETDQRRQIAIVIGLVLLALVFRLHELGLSPLRGDEAFAVRYWAAPPSEVLRGLAWTEPHPFGTFFLFWAWKSLVGDGEVAMRLLPVLVSLLGVPAMYALARRLTGQRQFSQLAALLWAISPNLIWHAQDVRNYAIWAALSLISMWLFLRAADSPGHRVNWLLYIIVATLALYVFFLEAFFVLVQGLYILLWRRKALRGWLVSLVGIGLLLLPWLGQLWALAHSPYSGTATHADLTALFSQFVPELLFSEVLKFGDLAFAAGVLLVAVIILGLLTLRWRGFLFLWLAVPTGMLILASTRLEVFRPRYLIAVSPVLILAVSAVLLALIDVIRADAQRRRLYRFEQRGWRVAGFQIGINLPPGNFTRAASCVFLSILIVPAVMALGTYYTDYHKAPDWFSLRDYLSGLTSPDDMVIMTSVDPSTGFADPAFEYYYPGPATVITLPNPLYDTAATVKQALATHRAVWFILVGANTAQVEDLLKANGVYVNGSGAGRSFAVHEYRAVQPKLNEIGARIGLSVGGGKLIGYTLDGATRTGSQLNLLLFWETPPDASLKVFIHLTGPANPSGSGIWAQDDHPPQLSGQALGRDVYHLDLSGVPPHDYSIEIGMYDPASGKRVEIVDLATGKSLGDSVVLTQIKVGPSR